MKKFLLFAFILASNTAFANSITFFVVPPPRELKWGSPSEIATSTIQASLSDSYHSIGHVTVKVDCSFKGQNVSFWSGMTSSDDNVSDNDLLFKKKVGLGILYYPYNGHFESRNEIEEDLQIAKNKLNRLFSLKFLINGDHCERVTNYFRQYQRYEVSKTYGLVHRPRYKEGAGCTAYAMSYLDVAGILDPGLKEHFGKFIRVPESLIGTDSKPVPFLELIENDKAKRWARKYEPHRNLEFYDTQFMYDWAKNIHKNDLWSDKVYEDTNARRQWHKMLRIRRRSGNDSRDRIIRKSNGFFGIILDKRHVSAAQDTIWKH